MQRAFGMDLPETVAEMCHPAAAAVLVYDAQAGILGHVRDREGLVGRIAEVLRAAMAWQRLDPADAVTSSFPPDAEHTGITAELAPADGEPVFDELGMSALVGTPLEVVLRDRRVTTLVLVGAVLEIGIEPTARHAADLGFPPVVVDDACCVVDDDAAQRSPASLDYGLLS